MKSALDGRMDKFLERWDPFFLKQTIKFLVLSLSFSLVQLPNSATASNNLTVAMDVTSGYDRKLFKHWIDEDGDGCNTRAEVLIEEAIVKPKIGPNCKLIGGRWLSDFDGKTITNASLLDVDHLVPLAEAWRSGAWSWNDSQRLAFANDLKNPETLIAVSRSANRSKGDRDPSNWLPKINTCNYVQKWISIKKIYSLSVDSKESLKLDSVLKECESLDSKSQLEREVLLIKIQPGIGYNGPDGRIACYHTELTKKAIKKYGISGTKWKIYEVTESVNELETFDFKLNASPIRRDYSFGSTVIVTLDSGVKVYTYVFNNNSPGVTYGCSFAAITKYGISPFTSKELIGKLASNNSDTTDNSNPTPTPTPTSTPIPTPTQQSPSGTITPGAFCSPPGSIGTSVSGVTYTCKSSPTDARNRWRQ